MKFTSKMMIAIILILVGISSVYIVNKDNRTIGSTINNQINILETQHNSQEHLLNDITTSLTKQGVPIKLVQIIDDERWNPPITLAYNFEVSNAENKAFCNMPIYSMMTKRAINMAQKKGLQIGAISETFVTPEGKKLSWAIKKVKTEVSGDFDLPHILDNDTIVTKLIGIIPFPGINIARLDVSLDNGDIRWTKINLQVIDIATANTLISDFIVDINKKIAGLNATEKAQIAIIQITMSTFQGEPIFTYVNNLQLKSTSWWEIEGLRGNWYPSPQPVQK
jgi:hypothetical protein